MRRDQLESEVKKMFWEFRRQADDIMKSSKDCRTASKRIENAILPRMRAENEGYLIELYTGLMEEVREDSRYKDPGYMNAVYALNLRDRMWKKNRLDITEIKAYHRFMEIVKKCNKESDDLKKKQKIVQEAVKEMFVYKKELQRATEEFLYKMEETTLQWLAYAARFFENEISSAGRRRKKEWEKNRN